MNFDSAEGGFFKFLFHQADLLRLRRLVEGIDMGDS
jgi:hypothetical protein